jgi:hypothetical protein
MMLTIRQKDHGSRAPTAGVTRRDLLRVGALTLGGLTLSELHRLRADPKSGGRTQKSVIMIHLSGGPSHLDMYDMKPDAPLEYRGEFQPIRTRVPGLDICELMPEQAKLADRFTILRGVRFAHLHSAHEFYSGYPWQETPRASVPGEAQRPALGSVVSRLRGTSAMPPYVSLHNQVQWERAYYLGEEHEPFRVGGNSLKDSLANMQRPAEVGELRITRRSQLLREFDVLRRSLDENQAFRAVDAFQSRALEIVTSGRVRDAFDVDREPVQVRTRYGEKPFAVRRQVCNTADYYQRAHPGRALLQARRLIEAGVSVVTCAIGEWDTHRYNFETLRAMLPAIDQAVSALILDLEDRGLLDDVVVLLGGEFGRTPRIGDVTPDGRSHWPEAGCLWMAGGGLRTGQVVGATDSRAERAVGPPIGMQNVLSTLYRVLGIDAGMTFRDFNGRPQYLLDERQPLQALL